MLTTGNSTTGFTTETAKYGPKMLAGTKLTILRRMCVHDVSGGGNAELGPIVLPKVAGRTSQGGKHTDIGVSKRVH